MVAEIKIVMCIPSEISFKDMKLNRFYYTKNC